MPQITAFAGGSFAILHRARRTDMVAAQAQRAVFAPLRPCLPWAVTSIGGCACVNHLDVAGRTAARAESAPGALVGGMKWPWTHGETHEPRIYNLAFEPCETAFGHVIIMLLFLDARRNILDAGDRQL